MQLSTLLLTLFTTTALALPGLSLPRDESGALFDRAVNDGRPVASGACCIANTSKKGDVCNNAGKAGVCTVADTAGCKYFSAFQKRGVEMRRLINMISGDARLTCI